MRRPSRSVARLAELIDGTSIPFSSVMVADNAATLTLDGATESDGDVAHSLPIAQLAAIRFQHLDDAARQAVGRDSPAQISRAMCSSCSSATAKASTTSKASSATFPTTRSNSSSMAKPSASIAPKSRASFTTALIAAERPIRTDVVQGSLWPTMRTPPKSSLTTRQLDRHHHRRRRNLRWPLDDIELADFSAGKVMYLSDIEPASAEVDAVGRSARQASTLAAEYGQPRRDQSAFGGPLIAAL